MIDHYNAFISYKHAPEDNKVAEAVHKGLERFHIPVKIQKKTGIKRINRIFRDTEELPITSDLNDTIAHALANSDYLIVICSTNTKQSAWVPREIEYFLRNHTKQQIFTVLVNGEPFDVIPEQLLYEDKTMLDSNGQQQVIRMPMEPLSCDYRMPMRKAHKIELPRLASGLIGCSYDELMNRRRQYRVKQMTAVFAATLALTVAFSGYMMYSRNSIRKNYLESLRNQSKYLANESQNYLEDEQRITALQLALEALPKDDKDDRPITAEATKALSNATLAYVGNTGENVYSAWNYQMPNYISDFKVSENGETISICDEGNTVCSWNTKTHELNLYIDNISSDIRGMEYLNNKHLLVWTDKDMFCYDAYNGDKIWEYTMEEMGSFEDQDNMMLNGDTFFIGLTNNKIVQMESSSGSVVKAMDIPLESEFGSSLLSKCKLSPDKKKIAFCGSDGMDKFLYGVLDVESGKVNLYDKNELRVKDIEWVGNDNIMLAEHKWDLSAGSIGYGDKEILTEDHTNIRCINPSDLKTKWAADFVYNGIMINSDFVPLGNNETVAYYSGDISAIYDMKTGNVLHINNLDDSIINASDANADGIPVYITRNGGYAYPSNEEGNNEVYYIPYFTDNIENIAINNGVYVTQRDSSEVIFYGLHEYDKNWRELDGDITFSSYNTKYYMDDKILTILTDEDDKAILVTYTLTGEHRTLKTELSDENSFSYEILGIHNGFIYIWNGHADSYQLIAVNIETGEKTTEEIPGNYILYGDYDKLKNGKLAYIYKDEDFNQKINIYDVEQKTNNILDVDLDKGTSLTKMQYFDDAEIIFFPGTEESIIDATNGDIHKINLPQGWAGTKRISQNSDENYCAISDEKKILIVKKNGEVSSTIRCPGLIPLGIAFIKGTNNIIVFYNNGDIYWYTRKGEFIKKSEASVYNNYSDDAYFEFDNDTKNIYVQMNKLTDVIDIESGVEIAHLLQCFGYHKPSDTFITESYDADRNIKVGYYKRYTVDELITKAKDILQGAELSDELKSQYGIED